MRHYSHGIKMYRTAVIALEVAMCSEFVFISKVPRESTDIRITVKKSEETIHARSFSSIISPYSFTT